MNFPSLQQRGAVVASSSVQESGAFRTEEVYSGRQGVSGSVPPGGGGALVAAAILLRKG
jgi:hypothetical protein